MDALTQVAAKEGYANTTVADVIAAAGASRSTFYEVFPDLPACVLAALEQAATALAEEVELALIADPDVDPARVCVDALLRYAERDTPAASLLFVESLAAGADALALRDGLVDRLAALVESTRARRAGTGAGGSARTRRGAGGQEPQGQVLDVPALALVCGVFRLLSMRLPRGESALHGLREELLAWVDSYSVDGPPYRWHAGAPLGKPDTRTAPAPAQRRTPPPLPRGRHKLSAAEIARNQRERIVHALAAESYEQGYSAITVTDIVRAAGVSRNVFYEQFADKQAAGVAALQATFEHAMVATAARFFAGADWPERIWGMAQALTEHYYAHPVEAHLSFVELHAIGGEGVQLAHERLSVFTLLLEEGYRQRPEAAALPRTVSEALVATVLELGYRQAPRPGVKRHPVLLGQQTYMCLAPFIGPAEATKRVRAWIPDA